MMNMKPADELLMIRHRIKEMQEREAQLKAGIASGEFEAHGNFAVASVTKRTNRRFDRKAAEAELGSLSTFDVETESTVVRIEELQDPTTA